jgi:hypothetical protein
MYVIAKFQGGISLNDYEYLLDENNVALEFPSELEAVNRLNELLESELTKEEWEEEGIFILELNNEN